MELGENIRKLLLAGIGTAAVTVDKSKEILDDLVKKGELTVEEAVEDLKMRTSQIEAIESGNMEVFKDVFSLKYFIRDYSKYLGLNYEDMVDEFNEYLFDYTSKISIEDIKKAKKMKKEEAEEVKRIASPYTIEHKRKFFIPKYMIIIFLLIVLVVAGFFVYRYIDDQQKSEEELIATNLLQ